MKHVSKLLIMLALILPNQSFAAFKSKEDLISAFVKAGFGYVIAIPGGNTSPDIEVQTVNNVDGAKSISKIDIGEFAKQTKSERFRPELNYVNNQRILMGLQNKFMGAKYALAYQVGEILLCYKDDADSTEYTDCYIFPTDINDVINALKATKQIK